MKWFMKFPKRNKKNIHSRLAAFEQLSVLAFHLNGKLDPILKLVKEYEQKCFEGLTAAVKVLIYYVCIVENVYGSFKGWLGR